MHKLIARVRNQPRDGDETQLHGSHHGLLVAAVVVAVIVALVLLHTTGVIGAGSH